MATQNLAQVRLLQLNDPGERHITGDIETNTLSVLQSPLMRRAGDWAPAIAVAGGVLGAAVVAGAIWLAAGVRELTNVRTGNAMNAMLAPRAGSGLFVVLLGGVLLLAAATLAWRDARTSVSRVSGAP